MRKQSQAKDGNHDAIKQLYVDAHFSVEDVHQWCRFDLIVALGGLTALVEIKDPTQKPSDRKLTKNEQKFHDTWKGEIAMIETPEDAIAHMARMRRRSNQPAPATGLSRAFEHGVYS